MVPNLSKRHIRMHTGEKSQVSPKGGCGKVDLKRHELLQTLQNGTSGCTQARNLKFAQKEVVERWI